MLLTSHVPSSGQRCHSVQINTYAIFHFTCLPATVLFASPNPLPLVSRTPMPHAAMPKNGDRKRARYVELVPFPREDINCG